MSSTIAMAEWSDSPLFADAYPYIRFLDGTAAEEADQYYATYRVGLFFDDAERVPINRLISGMSACIAQPRTSLASILRRPPLKLACPRRGAADREKYAVIATQATSQCKYWNNPFGWREIIRFLKDAGYRVICIDHKPVNGGGIVWNHVPGGAEDMTGLLSLAECVRWIRHAEFFVGSAVACPGSLGRPGRASL